MTVIEVMEENRNWHWGHWARRAEKAETSGGLYGEGVWTEPSGSQGSSLPGSKGLTSSSKAERTVCWKVRVTEQPRITWKRFFLWNVRLTLRPTGRAFNPQRARDTRTQESRTSKHYWLYSQNKSLIDSLRDKFWVLFWLHQPSNHPHCLPCDPQDFPLPCVTIKENTSRSLKQLIGRSHFP